EPCQPGMIGYDRPRVLWPAPLPRPEDRGSRPLPRAGSRPGPLDERLELLVGKNLGELAADVPPAAGPGLNGGDAAHGDHRPVRPFRADAQLQPDPQFEGAVTEGAAPAGRHVHDFCVPPLAGVVPLGHQIGDGTRAGPPQVVPALWVAWDRGHGRGSVLS